MNMRGNKIYKPNENHMFLITIFIILFICWLILIIFIWIDLLSNGYSPERASPILYLSLYTLIPMGIYGVYSNIGKYVFISERGISKPSIIRKTEPIYLSSGDIKNYVKVYNIHEKDEVVGVRITTRQGKKIKYLDSKTPDISIILLDLLKEYKIKEVKISEYALPPRPKSDKAIWDWNNIDREQDKKKEN